MAEMVLQAVLREPTEFLYATLSKFLSSLESSWPAYKKSKNPF
jgi:hypothetical protein